MIGLTIVLVLGVAIGIAMARWWRVRYFFTDLILVGITLPAFIWALLVVMWWGFSNIGPITVCVALGDAAAGRQHVPGRDRNAREAARDVGRLPGGHPAAVPLAR